MKNNFSKKLQNIFEDEENKFQSLRELIFAFHNLEEDDDTNDPDNLDVGLYILYELSQYLTDEQADFVIDEIQDISGLSDEHLDYYDSPDYDNADEVSVDNLATDYFGSKSVLKRELVPPREIPDESDKHMPMAEKKFRLRTSKQKRNLAKRGIAKLKLGVKADTEVFKRKFQFDAKKKMFVKRKNVITRKAWKGKIKKFLRVMRRKRRK